MGNYFGTDGIRGQYNSKLTVNLAFIIGQAAGSVFEVGSTVCVGQDPRRSSQVIQTALCSGLIATGINVNYLGVTSTPNVSHAIIKHKLDAGIMISASHNPFSDNGIKFFGADGCKLSDELELEIEKMIDTENFRLVDTEQLGLLAMRLDYVDDYVEFLGSNSCDLSNLKICIDCANGSGFEIAPKVFNNLNAKLTVIGNEPNGININENVGSTHTDTVAQMMQTGDYDFGFAFDGDADRIIMLAGDGTVLDGDYILFLLAKYLKENNQLQNDVVVTTVMANLGFIESMKELAIDVITTDVGDRFVMQGISKSQASLGGEQSGHIIIPNLLPTGDGILVSMILAKIFANAKTDIKTQALEMEKFPQVLLNKHVIDKNLAMKNEKLLSEITRYEEMLGSSGRILVRSSGTEELVRVMVEAKELKVCNDICNALMEFVN